MEEIVEYHAELMAELTAVADESSLAVEETFFERMASRLEMEGEIVTGDWVGFSDRSSGKPVRIDAIGGDPRESEGALDLSRFDAAPLIAFTATKEMNYGTETDGRIPARCGADSFDQRAIA